MKIDERKLKWKETFLKKMKKEWKIKLFYWDGKKCKRNEMVKLKCLGQ